MDAPVHPPPPLALHLPLHLVEPTLTGERGHQLSFAESLWTAAAGQPVRVWAGREANLPSPPPWVTVERHFARSLRKLQAPFLYRRLLAAPGRVLVATAGRGDLVALGLAAGRAAIPPGKVSLYFHWLRDGAAKRWLLARLARRHPGLQVLGPTPTVVAALRAAGFTRAAVVPYPMAPDRRGPGGPAGPVPFSHLCFAGAPRQDKGFGRLVDLVEHLAAAGERLPVAYQRAAAPGSYDEATRRDLARLDRAAYPALQPHPEPLPAADYAALFTGGVCVQAYHQRDFADRVSGVTLDAFAAGCPVVALSGTWTARAVERFGAGEVVAEAAPATLLGAVRRVVAGYAGYQAAARRAGEALRLENDARRLWDAVMGEPARAP